MDKDLKDYKFYPTPAHEEFIKNTYGEMINMMFLFSKLSKTRSGFNFTEYSMLTSDLYEFYQINLKTQHIYKLKDIISFRNSFELIYKRLKKIATLEHVQLYTFFRDKLKYLNRWAEEIELIAINRLEG